MQVLQRCYVFPKRGLKEAVPMFRPQTMLFFYQSENLSVLQISAAIRIVEVTMNHYRSQLR